MVLKGGDVKMKVRGARMGFLLSIACVTVAIYGLGINILGFESVTYISNPKKVEDYWPLTLANAPEEECVEFTTFT